MDKSYLNNLDRFQLALKKHLNYWNIEHVLHKQAIEGYDKPISFVNCILEPTACTNENDCNRQCIQSSFGKIKCIKGMCMNEKVTVPECNLDNGGAHVAIYDAALQSLVWKCQCMNPSIYHGISCDLKNPMYCINGKINESNNVCECFNVNDVKIKFQKYAHEFDTVHHYMCINPEMYNYLKLNNLNL
ncbi:hypothetical protein PV326_001628 [Microctonus aethiopoides]|nr:hypothetical protein PV326_001628 [Microctonus aethiopoides]